MALPLASTNLVAHISLIPDLGSGDAWQASTEAVASAFPDYALEVHTSRNLTSLRSWANSARSMVARGLQRATVAIGCAVFVGTAAWIATFPVSVSV